MASGYILHQDRLRVVIATLDSENAKTGDMIQVWILSAREVPTDAVRSGADAAVCGNCKWRPRNVAATMEKHGLTGRAGCYVNVGQGPGSIWRTWRAGRYSQLAIEDYPAVFGGRKVRLGAYGDPAFIPPAIVRAIVDAAAGHTGYTHQWRYPVAAHLLGVCMASCGTMAEMSAALADGWGVFLTRPMGTASAPGTECPYKNGVQCNARLACNGESGRVIWIAAHGSGARNVSRLIQQIESAPAVKRQGA